MKIEINLDGAKRKMSQQSKQQGQYALANQTLADMNQFVPKKDGILRLTGTIDTDGGGINYNMPYARRLFYMPMRNYTTPGTGPRWDLKAKSQFMSDWINAFMKGAQW